MIADISEVLLLAGLSGSCTETERAIASSCLRAANAAVIRHLQYDPQQKTRTEYYPQGEFTNNQREGIWDINETEAFLRSRVSGNHDELQLLGVPIRSITSLYIDYDGRNGTRSGAFAASTLKTEGTDFWPNYDGVDSSGNKICRDGILRSIGLWPDEAGSVKVTYVAGYSEAELHGQDTVIDAYPILESVLDETQRRILKVYSRSKKRLAGFAGALTSENLGDYSYSTDAGMMAGLVGGRDILPETEHKLQQFMRYDWGVV